MYSSWLLLLTHLRGVCALGGHFAVNSMLLVRLRKGRDPKASILLVDALGLLQTHFSVKFGALSHSAAKHTLEKFLVQLRAEIEADEAITVDIIRVSDCQVLQLKVLVQIAKLVRDLRK